MNIRLLEKIDKLMILFINILIYKNKYNGKNIQFTMSR